MVSYLFSLFKKQKSTSQQKYCLKWATVNQMDCFRTACLCKCRYIKTAECQTVIVTAGADGALRGFGQPPFISSWDQIFKAQQLWSLHSSMQPPWMSMIETDACYLSVHSSLWFSRLEWLHFGRLVLVRAVHFFCSISETCRLTVTNWLKIDQRSWSRNKSLRKPLLQMGSGHYMTHCTN